METDKSLIIFILFIGGALLYLGIHAQDIKGYASSQTKNLQIFNQQPVSTSNTNTNNTNINADTNKNTYTNTYTEKNTTEETVGLPSSDVEVGVNYPMALSYKTKQEVYDLRKRYVRYSIFRIPNYEPSDAVFGQIEDNKPWISSDFCKDANTNMSKIDGTSEESRFINNPTMLVAIEFPFMWSPTQDSSFCNSSINQLIPANIFYSKIRNEIVVKYKYLPFNTKNDSFYSLNGINARDIGYPYAYVDMSRSTFRPNFSDKTNNISIKVQEFQNFIHVGGSCGHPEGCNNGSPRQPAMEFQDDGTGHGDIYIKLWRTMPSSPAQTPDITERIIIGN